MPGQVISTNVCVLHTGIFLLSNFVAMSISISMCGCAEGWALQQSNGRLADRTDRLFTRGRSHKLIGRTARVFLRSNTRHSSCSWYNLQEYYMRLCKRAIKRIIQLRGCQQCSVGKKDLYLSYSSGQGQYLLAPSLLTLTISPS